MPWCAKRTPVENQWSADQWFPMCVPQTSSIHIAQEPVRNAGFLPHLRLTTYESVFSVVVQFSSVAQSCPTLCDPMNRSTPGLPVHHQLPEFTQTQCPSSQRCHPAISSSVVPFSSCPQSFPELGSFPMSQLFVRMRWPTYWSFSFNISPSNEHPGLISFKSLSEEDI